MREHGSGRAADAVRRIDPQVDAAWTERGIGELGRRRRRAQVARGASVLLVASGIAAVGSIAWLGTQRAPSDVAAAPAEEAVDREIVRFADGSSVRADPGSEVVPRHLSEERVEVALVRGSADTEVTPDPRRRFALIAGPVRVEVLGTAFRVELDDDHAHARVAVRRGRVRVSWGGGERELAVGEEGRFPPDAAPATIARDDTAAAPDDLAPDDEVVSVAAPRARGRSSRAPDWRELAGRGAYAEAYDLLEGEPRESPRSIEDLLLAADAARLSGHPAAALPYLARASRDHARDPRAALAAFTAGRLLMSLERPREAAIELERALALDHDGTLAEHALARAALAHLRAGDRARGGDLARMYLERHPEGRWSARIRASLAEDGTAHGAE
jgi:transmembrane sensor